MDFEGFFISKFEVHVTKIAPQKAQKLIAWGKLTFDERFVVHRVEVYLTQCIDWWVLESQLPHKNVNLISWLGIVNNRLTILLGSWLSKTN